jgi:hypothetical protein
LARWWLGRWSARCRLGMARTGVGIGRRRRLCRRRPHRRRGDVLALGPHRLGMAKNLGLLILAAVRQVAGPVIIDTDARAGPIRKKRSSVAMVLVRTSSLRIGR